MGHQPTCTHWRCQGFLVQHNSEPPICRLLLTTVKVIVRTPYDKGFKRFLGEQLLAVLCYCTKLKLRHACSSFAELAKDCQDPDFAGRCIEALAEVWHQHCQDPPELQVPAIQALAAWTTNFPEHCERIRDMGVALWWRRVPHSRTWSLLRRQRGRALKLLEYLSSLESWTLHGDGHSKGRWAGALFAFHFRLWVLPTEHAVSLKGSSSRAAGGSCPNVFENALEAGSMNQMRKSACYFQPPTMHIVSWNALPQLNFAPCPILPEFNCGSDHRYEGVSNVLISQHCRLSGIRNKATNLGDPAVRNPFPTINSCWCTLE